MTPSLRELQAGFARAILAGDAALASWIVDDGIAASSRLGIHANHYRLSLIEALGTTFAPVRRLVGDDFFDALVRRYLMRHPPAGPCLFEYGAGLGDFAAGDPAGRRAPFLADVLRFAFALNRAGTAPDTASVTPADIANVGHRRLPGLRFRLHPTATLLASPYPVTALWHLAVEGTDAAPTVDLDAGGERLVFWRDLGRPAWRRIDPGEHAFLAALAGGESFAVAVQAATEIDPLFHLAEALGLALRHGLLAHNPEGSEP